MTTATAPTTTDLIDQLRARLAALPDPDDLGAPNARERLRQHRAEIESVVVGLRGGRPLAKWARQLDEAEADRARLTQAIRTLDDQHAAARGAHASGRRGCVTRRRRPPVDVTARNALRLRVQALAHALDVAQHRGVTYSDGVPDVPGLLVQALGGYVPDAQGRLLAPWARQPRHPRRAPRRTARETRRPSRTARHVRAARRRPAAGRRHAMKLGEIARVCGALPICRRKVRHTTAEAAAQHLREVEAKHGHIARLKIYSCPLCLGFHVGKARRWP